MSLPESLPVTTCHPPTLVKPPGPLAASPVREEVETDLASRFSRGVLAVVLAAGETVTEVGEWAEGLFPVISGIRA